MNFGWGFFYALTAAVLWGMLPAFLLLALQVMDSSTITWYRFVFAGTLVFGWLAVRGQLPRFRHGQMSMLPLVALAATALVVNYVGNVQGIAMISPETAQIVMQLAPFLLMLGGVVVFKERMGAMEWGGVALLVIGLGAFFNHKWLLLFESLGQYTQGVLIIVLAAAAWALYALLQKLLFKAYSAGQLTMLMYLLGAILLFPFASLSSLQNAQSIHLWALLFCCANTLVAYGAFTKALNVWHAAKVGAVLALTPVFTFISMHIAASVAPDTFTTEPFSGLSYAGAIMVIIGSMLAAMGRGQQKPVKDAQ